MAKIRSYTKQGHTYFMNTGGYHEREESVGLQKTSARKNIKDEGYTQKNLCNPNPQSAAAITLQNVMKELNCDIK